MDTICNPAGTQWLVSGSGSKILPDTEVLRMDPLPWGAFVAPQFRQAQFKPPEPDPPAH